jgi:hypothetical protein
MSSDGGTTKTERVGPEGSPEGLEESEPHEIRTRAARQRR